MLKKRLCPLLLSLIMLVSFTACKKGGDADRTESAADPSSAVSDASSGESGSAESEPEPAGDASEPVDTAAGDPAAEENPILYPIEISQKAANAVNGFAGAPDAAPMPAVTPEEETEINSLLDAVPPEKLDLYADQSHYQWVFGKDTQTIDGKTCYSVQALNPNSLRREIMGNYYVARDDHTIYKYDLITGENIRIEM